jgi:hypothetical protein
VIYYGGILRAIIIQSSVVLGKLTGKRHENSINELKICEISSSHGGEYEDGGLLDC